MINIHPHLPRHRTNLSHLSDKNKSGLTISQLLGHCAPLSISNQYAALDEILIIQKWRDLLDRNHTAIAIEPRGEDEQPS